MVEFKKFKTKEKNIIKKYAALVTLSDLCKLLNCCRTTFDNVCSRQPEIARLYNELTIKKYSEITEKFYDIALNGGDSPSYNASRDILQKHGWLGDGNEKNNDNILTSINLNFTDDSKLRST